MERSMFSPWKGMTFSAADTTNSEASEPSFSPKEDLWLPLAEHLPPEPTGTTALLKDTLECLLSLEDDTQQ